MPKSPDLSDTYLKILLDEESQKVIIINTPDGLFKYTRLCLWIAFSHELFQRLIEQLIKGISKTATYIDALILGVSEITIIRV